MENKNGYNDFLMEGAKALWEDLLYPVELVPQNGPSIFGSQKFMVVRTDTRQVLSLVSDRYSLITNAEALELGKNILEHVYKEKFGNLLPTKILPNAECTHFVASFMPENYTFELAAGDKWTPFVYIQNSYDKTSQFRCWVGMGRVVCLNGLIFGNVAVKISTKHKIDNVRYEIMKKLRVNQTELNFKNQKKLYTEVFTRLMEIPVKQEWVRPLVCGAFEVSYFKNHRDVMGEISLIHKRYHQRKSTTLRNKADALMRFMKITDDFWKIYSDSLGLNAYALYNVITDISTHEPGILNRVVNNKLSPVQLTIKASEWAKHFVSEYHNKNFNIHQYIKDYLPLNEIPVDEYYLPH
jgi:hypothetical protein